MKEVNKQSNKNFFPLVLRDLFTKELHDFFTHFRDSVYDGVRRDERSLEVSFSTTRKEISNLLVENERDPEPVEMEDKVEKYRDTILQDAVRMYGKLFTKPPFKHESLLVDRKDKKLSRAEKRLAGIPIFFFLISLFSPLQATTMRAPAPLSSVTRTWRVA